MFRVQLSSGMFQKEVNSWDLFQFRLHYSHIYSIVTKFPPTQSTKYALHLIITKTWGIMMILRDGEVSPKLLMSFFKGPYGGKFLLHEDWIKFIFLWCCSRRQEISKRFTINSVYCFRCTLQGIEHNSQSVDRIFP